MTISSDNTQPNWHGVQFYKDDDYLIDKVAEFIAAGLDSGASGLVIATEPHLAALEPLLTQHAATRARERAAGAPRCLFFNANSLLTRFMVDGWPDEKRFNDLANEIFDALAQDGQSVAAFGEMVSVLCEEGNRQAAIRLEELWNALARRKSFSLLCGYPIAAFSDDASGSAFRAVCDRHADVCPAEQHDPAGREQDGARMLARLQQKRHVLEVEIDRRKSMEQALSERERILIEQKTALSLANENLQREIERRRNSEKELLHAQHVLTIAQKVAHLGSWEIDANESLHCSDEYFRICGLEPQSKTLTIESVLDMVHPDDREAVSRAVHAARENKTPYRVEKRVIRPDGEIRHVLSQGHMILDEQENPVAVIGSFLDITERKQSEAALRKMTQDLRQLAAYQERLKEEERARIAREVHDELGSLLTCLKAYVTVSMERGVKAGLAPDPLLGEACGLADTAIDTIRRIITDLRPSVLDALGVWAALEWYADQISNRTGLTCHCTIARSASSVTLDKDRSTMLFRIVQEALTNIVRHAGASVITIGATCVAGSLVVEIDDDGKGFDAAQASDGKSWGIHGMHERARHFGGELRIAGRPGQGTTVHLILPLEA